MSCYYPRFIWNIGVDEEGKKHPMIFWPKDGKHVKFDYAFEKDRNPDLTMIPCGKCLGCRLDYSRQWADRMMLQLETSKTGMFITMTYDNDHVPVAFDENDIPIGLTLNKKDFQDFFKRLRREFDGKDGHPGPYLLKYYAAGEYGSTTFRPHGHCIIFGIGLDQIPDLVSMGCNNLHQEFFKSDFLSSVWSNGSVLVSDVSYQTCAYVARYVTKKAFADVTMKKLGVEEEFSLMSRRPGIGKEYLEQHPDCFDYVNIKLRDGRSASIPRYFMNQLDDERKRDIMTVRKQLADDSTLYRLQESSLSFLEQKSVEERRTIASTKVLKRSLE